MLRPDTIALLQRIKEHIMEEPRRLDMNHIMIDLTKKGDHGTRWWQLVHTEADEPPCGTVGCISGWATYLTTGQKATTLNNGKRALKLDGDQADRLFAEPRYTETHLGWPKNFADRYMEARTPRERAVVTCERIDHFIKTGGAE